MYYVYRSTTDKLNEAFQQIDEAGDEPVMPIHWLGARDWLIVVRKAVLLPRPARPRPPRVTNYSSSVPPRRID